jgi:pimeloyl-ACP methyl ester carboxylesterase
MAAVLRIDNGDGLTLALHDLGGSGAELFCAHATGFHGMAWQPMAAALADRYHVTALDFRGHGDSDTPADHTFLWEGFGRDVLAAVDALDLAAPAGVGHSMGCAALLMAELDRPGTFRALVLYEPIVFPPDLPRPEGGSPLIAGARRRREMFGSRQDAFDSYAAKPPLSALRPDVLRAYVDHGFADQHDDTVVLKCRRENEARTYEGSGSQDTYARLGRVGCPVLVLAGDVDQGGNGMGPATWSEDVARRIPTGSFERLHGIGHFGPLEDPDRVAGVLDTFLRSDRP